MSELLRKHINKFIKVTKEEADGIVNFFEKQELKKKENVLVKGQICDRNFFVVKGCLRMFFINDKGVEQTTQFAIENWWLSDYMAYGTKNRSDYFIQAVERTELLSIHYAQEELLLESFPVMERYFRHVHQRAHAAAQFRIKGVFSLSREEAYYLFAKRFPEFVNRVPQYLLASYLGFTPEYLSEIRGKKRS